MQENRGEKTTVEKLSHALSVSINFGYVKMTLLVPNIMNRIRRTGYIFPRKIEDQIHVNLKGKSE